MDRKVCLFRFMVLMLFIMSISYGLYGIFENTMFCLAKEEAGDAKKIALTFDDGPNQTWTLVLLDGLKKRNAKATFFVLGEHVEEFPELIERMNQEGHLIGNHTYSHIQLTEGNRDQYKQELIKTSELVQNITGKEVLYVRPPYGSWDKTFEKELNMFPVLWNIDPVDWCSTDADCIVQKVLKQTKENAIILMHDNYESTVMAALQVVDILQKQGYQFVTVDELLFD